MPVRKFFLLFLFGCCLCSCVRTQPDPEVSAKAIKEKYKFTHIAVQHLPNETFSDVYVPFLDNGKYYISNYLGKRMSSQSWDKVSPLSENPFFLGWRDGQVNIYRYPGTLMLEHPIEEKELIGIVGVEFEKNLYHAGILAVTVDTLLNFPIAKPSAAPEKVVEVPDPGMYKVTYYIGLDQTTKATECYFNPTERTFKKSKFYRKGSYGGDYLRNYIVVFTMRQGYNLVNMHGQRVFKKDFWDITTAYEQFIIGKNEEGKFAVGNPADGVMSPFAFDTIEIIHGCDSSFYGSQYNGSTIDWFLVKLDGSFSPVKEKLKDCRTIEIEEVYQPSEKSISIFNKGDKYGAKNEMDSVILQPEYELMYMIKNKRWITAKKNGQYGVYHADGYWIYPIEPRDLYLVAMTDSTGLFTLQENGYNFTFNDKLEVIFENPPVFFPNSFFNWAAVPANLRPADLNKIERPAIYQQYMGFYDGTYSHVFDASGKYISSHLGKYTPISGFQKLSFFTRRDGREIPIGMFVSGDKDYYVRLSDGFEYRAKSK